MTLDVWSVIKGQNRIVDSFKGGYAAGEGIYAGARSKGGDTENIGVDIDGGASGYGFLYNQ